jgi:hypothetical protein
LLWQPTAPPSAPFEYQFESQKETFQGMLCRQTSGFWDDGISSFRMDTVTLRQGNSAFDYLVNNYSDRIEKFHLVKCLPDLAALMSREAKTTSEGLLKRETLQERISQMLALRENLTRYAC